MQRPETAFPYARALSDVPDDMPYAQLCMLGEIDIKREPKLWHGWPNGSLMQGKSGHHMGRVIRTASGAYHVLLWNRLSAKYTHRRTVKTFAEAMTVL